MKDKNKIKKEQRIRRHKRVRAKISGTKNVPRIAVFKSNKSLYASIIDDESGKTITSKSTMKVKKGKPLDQAGILGEELSKLAIEKKIKKAVFDKGGYRYTGKIKALADGLRKGGLEF